MPSIRAERRKLQQWLVTNLEVKWGIQVTRVEQNENGAAIPFQDGTFAHSDIVIGANGVYSPGRFA